jgi:hypothetical protein
MTETPGPFHVPKLGAVPPAAVNDQHIFSDKDNSRDAQHHSLGTGQYQAAPGNHKSHSGDTEWVTPTLSGTWLYYGWPFATPGYRRLNGIVYLKGLVKNGGLVVIFQLPVGFRPLEQRLFSSQGVSPQRIDVLPNGEVTYIAPGVSGQPADSSYIDIGNIMFPAEA